MTWRNGRKRAGLVALMLAPALVLVGCTSAGPDDNTGGGGPVDVGDPNTFNAGAVKDNEGDITMGVEVDIQNWNTNTAVGSVTGTMYVTNAIYPRMWHFLPDGSTVKLNEDLMESVEVASTNPLVIDYTIQKDAVWSDGVPISSDDFQYIYQALNTRDCTECQTSGTDGFDQVADFSASADKKSFTLTMKANFVDYQKMYSNPVLPAHIAATYGSMPESFNKGFADNVPEWSGGPFIISEYDRGEKVTMIPNPKWYGDGPHLKSLSFRFITDSNQLPLALRNGEIDMMVPKPQVDLLETIEGMASAGISYQQSLSMVYNNLTLNVSEKLLKDREVRRALYAAINIKDIIARTVGQMDSSIEPLGSLVWMSQQAGYENKLQELGVGLGKLDDAKKMLKDAGYVLEGTSLKDQSGEDVDPLRIVYPKGDQTSSTVAELVAKAAADLGIGSTIESTDSLGKTTFQTGNYGFDVFIVGYTGTPFLASNAAQRWVTGRGYNIFYSNPEVDRLVGEAVVADDYTQATALLKKVDNILLNDAWILPLYQQPALMAYRSDLRNVRNNPTFGGPTYNVQEWGIAAD